MYQQKFVKSKMEAKERIDMKSLMFNTHSLQSHWIRTKHCNLKLLSHSRTISLFLSKVMIESKLKFKYERSGFFKWWESDLYMGYLDLDSYWFEHIHHWWDCKMNCWSQEQEACSLYQELLFNRSFYLKVEDLWSPFDRYLQIEMTSQMQM